MQLQVSFIKLRWFADDGNGDGDGNGDDGNDGDGGYGDNDGDGRVWVSVGECR